MNFTLEERIEFVYLSGYHYGKADCYSGVKHRLPPFKKNEVSQTMIEAWKKGYSEGQHHEELEKKEWKLTFIHQIRQEMERRFVEQINRDVEQLEDSLLYNCQVNRKALI